MEYYSAIKRKEITAFAATWMDLEVSTLSEVSQVGRQHQMLSLMWYLKKGHNELLCRADTDAQTEKLMVSKSDRKGAGGGGAGVWDGNAIILGCDGRCTTINVIEFIE